MRNKISKEKLLNKFFSNIRKQEDGCWIWTASHGKYAQMWNGIKLIAVHTFSYETFKIAKYEIV